MSNEAGRALSVLLRLLVADKLLEAGWREVAALGPTIRFPDISRFVERYEGSRSVYLFAGSGDGSNLPLGMMLFGRIPPPKSDDEIRDLLMQQPDMYVGTLKRFLLSDCCIIDGVPIRRESLIRYIANHAGGAHLGSKPVDPNKPEYVALSELEANGLRGGPIPGSRLLIGDEGIDAIYYEVIAMADIIVRCNDIAEKLMHCVDTPTGWPPPFPGSESFSAKAD